MLARGTDGDGIIFDDVANTEAIGYHSTETE
jgi:hypothetical protein